MRSRRSQFIVFISLLLSLVFYLPSWNTQATQHNSSTWHAINDQGELKIKLYFFWSKTCPHCALAHPFIDELTQQYPWIELESHVISDENTQALWEDIAAKTGTEARSVPYMASCEKAMVGYTSDNISGTFLANRLKNCYLSLGGQLAEADLPSNTTIKAQPNATNTPLFATCGSESGDGTCDASSDINSVEQAQVQAVELPLLGVVSPQSMSLPLLTLVLAGVDAFNPCAFFVLLFLLSIMVNAKSRSRMLIVGGIFVFFSGFIYFLFMTAWLNIFKLLGAGNDGSMIIFAAGCLALIAGVINVKEYFFSKGDVSLSMSTQNRGSLIKRMAKLSNTSSLGALILGSTVLAILANAYELLCTAGFPMIYTSVLSMHNLSDAERYLYLLFYNLVYVVPLALIVIVFSATLGKRKLSEKEGQTLKLMSGIMMLGMGMALVIDPTALQNIALALALIFGSLSLTAVIVMTRKYKNRKQRH